MSFDAPVTIRHVRFANEQTGWAVLDAAAEDGVPVALVGPLVHLETGERARVVGEWVTDNRFGRQVKVAEAHPLAPQDRDTVIAYLKRVKHIGLHRAQTLVGRYGPAEVFDAIDGDPDAVLASVGLTGKRAEQAASSWRGLRVTRRLHLLLAPHGLAYLAGRIHEHHGSQAHDLIVADPYQLTSIFGVGFVIADRIARGLGDGAIGPGQRERAAVMHVLREAERNGSACTPLPDVLARARELVGGAVAKDVVDELVTAGQATCEGDWIYRTATAELEAELTERVHALVSAEASEKLAARPGSVLDPGNLVYA